MRITCDDGARAPATRYTIGTGGSSVVALLRDHLAPRLIGRDPDRDRGDLEATCFFATHATAVGAITSLALAAIDTALWDLRCRRAGLPLWKVAGGAQPRGAGLHHRGRLAAPSAASSSSTRRVAAKAQGFRGAKVKVGKPAIAEDVARLARRARGRRRATSRSWSTPTRLHRRRGAAPRARATSRSASRWFEEPLPAEDLGGHVELAAHAPMPIAVGESLYSPGALPRVPRARRLLDRAGRLRAHRRHHAVAQGRAPRRDVQRRRSARTS